MGQKPRSRLRYAATVAALLSVLLQAWLGVQAAGMKSGRALVTADADAVQWLLASGAAICHSVQPAEDETPGHGPKKVFPCQICAGLQGPAPLAQAKCSTAFEPVEIALVFAREVAAFGRAGDRMAFEARGPPGRAA
jgi:hypothetical protein